MRYQFLRFPGGREKAVTFSYDDGNRNDLQLVETLDRYGIKCTFNINSEMIAAEPGQWRLTAKEIRQHLMVNGHEIAVHGHSHRAEGKQRPIEGIKDVLECRLQLEAMFGGIIRGMAYPDSGIRSFENGTDYQTIREYLKYLDITYVRTLGADNDRFELPQDWYCWIPTAHHDNPEIMQYIKKFNESYTDETYCASRSPKLFYLWGHSFEYDRNQNWDHLTEICEALAGHEDTWYANNTQIYEYVQAYNGLVWNAAGTKAYNPSLIKVWIEIDGKLYSIGSGETLSI